MRKLLLTPEANRKRVQESQKMRRENQNLESPKQEMARLIRIVAGARGPGETDEHLRRRAARRLGMSAGRARTLWFSGTDNIRSDEMDRARDLAAVQPIQEAIDAVESAERY